MSSSRALPGFFGSTVIAFICLLVAGNEMQTKDAWELAEGFRQLIRSRAGRRIALAAVTDDRVVRRFDRAREDESFHEPAAVLHGPRDLRVEGTRDPSPHGARLARGSSGSRPATRQSVWRMMGRGDDGSAPQLEMFVAFQVRSGDPVGR